jgi:Serine carboxypeptidase S28
MLLNSAVLLALAFHDGVVNGIRHDVLKHNHEMATQNMYPDGTPMDLEMADMLRRRQAKPEAKFQTEWARLPLDHWDASAGTFLNRFWVTEENYKPGGPVFVYDAGEGNALGAANSMLSSGSFFSQIVKKFHGIGIAWEHRCEYYHTRVSI